MPDDEVITGLQAGGRAAEVALKSFAKGETARHMQAFFLHRGVPGQDTLDVLQETLFRIHRYAGDYRGDGAARSWFWQIARSSLADYWRHAGRGTADSAALAEESSRLSAVRSAGVQSVENGVKITRLPYAGERPESITRSPTPWIGTVDDEQWTAIEDSVAAPACAVGQTVAECIGGGFENFANQDPKRAHVLGMQMDGHSITEIAACIGRTVAATKEYLSQCKKKIKPFIEHCRDLQEA